MNTLSLLVLPLGMAGPWQIAILVMLVILLFGAKKIPELMRGMGRGVKEFKDAVSKDYTAEDVKTNETVKNNETTKIE